ncbi:MAG: helix-hairpin-helix domain-containing protein [Ignavibacteriales bacterium]|nr:helix-hairpin-helix domain-containing protein [Ignavibacteriales bacterium]
MLFLKKFFSRISEKTGLTQYEVKAVISFTLLLATGMIYSYYSNRPEKIRRYNYSMQDSLYNAIIGTTRAEIDTAKDSATASLSRKSVKTEKLLPGQKIKINSAAEEKLCLIPGIGIKTADEILIARQRGVVFKKSSDLLEVKGIGKKKLAKLMPFISFD